MRPDNVDLLFSEQELLSDFNNFEVVDLSEEKVRLDEGIYHQGDGMVLQFMGRKL